MKEMPSVLVGCPVSQVKEYCISQYLVQCLNLTYPNKTLHWIDNSVNQQWHVHNLLLKGFSCDYVHQKGRRNQVYITECQNMLRQKAIYENFDYLFMLECDIFCQLNIIEQLMAYDEDICAARYLIGEGDKSQILATAVDSLPFGMRSQRNMEEGFLEFGRKKTNNRFFGFGCILWKTEIIKHFPFHVEEKVNAHADMYAFMDYYEAGIKVQEHPVLVGHRNSSWSQIKDFN